MTDLERRLRTGLAALAEEVPPNTRAWAEQRRRLAAGGWRPVRRPLLAAAAAALVLAGVASASVLNRSAGPPAGPPATQSLAPTRSLPPIYDPDRDDPYRRVLSGPFDLGEFAAGTAHWRAATFVERHLEEGGTWTQRVCVVIARLVAERPDGPFEAYPPDCAPLPGMKVASRAVRAEGAPIGPMPGVLLFATVPQVASLEVCAGDRSPAKVTELGRTSGLALFRADFTGSTEGFCFTARDAAGRVIESGIT